MTKDVTLEVYAEAVEELRDSTRNYLRNLKAPQPIKLTAFQEMKIAEDKVDNITASILSSRKRLREPNPPNGLFRGYHPNYAGRNGGGISSN